MKENFNPDQEELFPEVAKKAQEVSVEKNLRRRKMKKYLHNVARTLQENAEKHKEHKKTLLEEKE